MKKFFSNLIAICEGKLLENVTNKWSDKTNNEMKTQFSKLSTKQIFKWDYKSRMQNVQLTLCM